MQFAILLTLVAASYALPYYGTGVSKNINRDGGIVIDTATGNRVTIFKGTGKGEQKYIDVSVEGPNISKRVHFELEGDEDTATSQAELLADILRQYEGVVDQQTYERLIMRLVDYVQSRLVDGSMLEVLRQLQADNNQQINQYMYGKNVGQKTWSRIPDVSNKINSFAMPSMRTMEQDVIQTGPQTVNEYLKLQALVQEIRRQQAGQQYLTPENIQKLVDMGQSQRYINDLKFQALVQDILRQQQLGQKYLTPEIIEQLVHIGQSQGLINDAKFQGSQTWSMIPGVSSKMNFIVIPSRRTMEQDVIQTGPQTVNDFLKLQALVQEIRRQQAGQQYLTPENVQQLVQIGQSQRYINDVKFQALVQDILRQQQSGQQYLTPEIIEQLVYTGQSQGSINDEPQTWSRMSGVSSKMNFVATPSRKTMEQDVMQTGPQTVNDYLKLQTLVQEIKRQQEGEQYWTPQYTKQMMHQQSEVYPTVMGVLSGSIAAPVVRGYGVQQIQSPLLNREQWTQRQMQLSQPQQLQQLETLQQLQQQARLQQQMQQSLQQQSWPRSMQQLQQEIPEMQQQLEQQVTQLPLEQQWRLRQLQPQTSMQQQMRQKEQSQQVFNPVRYFLNRAMGPQRQVIIPQQGTNGYGVQGVRQTFRPLTTVVGY